MTKPHVIMHMGSSIDGRITGDWPKDYRFNDVYEKLHADLKGDAWIVGRVTMAEFAKGEPHPVTSEETFPRTTWKAPQVTAGPYAVAVDRSGKLHLNSGTANGDPVIAVLTTTVADAHLAELRRDGISYIFAGDTEIDLAQALEILSAEFAIKRLLLEGGGGINGSFLSAGLIDEISLLIIPLADGNPGPTTFDRPDGKAAPFKLQSVDRLDNDILHLHYLRA